MAARSGALISADSFSISFSISANAAGPRPVWL
jgi:hypothetical protein